MRHDLISDVFSIMKSFEAVGRRECTVPASKSAKAILSIMKKHGYIGNFSFIEDGKSGKFKVSLVGRINNANVIRPRFSVKREELIKFEKRFLPASDVGILIISTSEGVMDQKDAKEKNIGGKLLGFVY